MSLELKTVEKEDIILLKNLYQLYLYDLSPYTGEKINSAGLFNEESIELFLSEDDLKAFFIIYKRQIIGFILIQSGIYSPMKDVDYYISEFFILAQYRKNRLGLNSLKILFNNYPGTYLSGQLSNNQPALRFWNSVYKTLKINTDNYIQSLEDCNCLNFILQKFKI